MNKPVRQHYVPQAYLKFFAQKREKIWETDVADKKGQKLYRANIRDIAFEKNFYTIERLGPQKYTWEKYYAEQVEPLISNTFTELIEKCTNIFAKDKELVINSRIKLALSVIIITQLLRTPKARSQQYEISSDIFPKVMGNVIKELRPHIRADQKDYLYNLKLDDIFKETQMQIITDPKRVLKFAQILCDRYWIVYRNDKFNGFPFVTSDHPVVEYNMLSTSTLLQKNGIGNPQTIIHYPINPQLMLAIYDKHNFLFQFLDSMDGRLVFLTQKDSDYILKVNQLQYEQCIQHAFFRPFT